MSKRPTPLLLKLLFIPASFFLLFSVLVYCHNASFLDFTDRLFREELQGNTLSLHYTLKTPETYGIEEYPVTLGNLSPEAVTASAKLSSQYQEELSRFAYRALSRQNRLTYDILDLYFKNQMSGQNFAFYSEPLGPTIGTQAQLPILLAEYAFYRERDLDDYFALLANMEDYYASILEYEKEKARRGLFMNDTLAEQIISQCRAFIQDPGSNFLITTFTDRISETDFLTNEEKAAYIDRNAQAVADHVISAYQLLIDGLTALKGSGSNEKGLCYLTQGKQYYEYLVRDLTGCYTPVEQIRTRIESQLQSDFNSMRALAEGHPELLAATETLGSAIAFSLDNSPSTILEDDTWYLDAQKSGIDIQKEDVFEELSPEEILEDLEGKITEDFPKAPEAHYTVKFVHESLEDYLSPAFYLTPPIDDLSENVIYINRGSTYSPLDLYTTLAHEGYPGHLYQTVYCSQKNTDPVRCLFSFGGYTEGWATYVEMYSYGLADTDPNEAELYRLNRSLSLGISSLMDIAVHYYGFGRSEVAAYLGNFGFQEASANALYDALLESPANYLKYYVGYLNFMDLRDAVKEQEGDRFSLKRFHTQVLSLGEAQFPVLAKYLLG